MEAHALRKQGWTISAIARHLGCNRRTIRNYLNETTTPGVRAKPQVDPFGEFVDYVTARLMEDPHLWARTLCDELEDLGYRQSYQTLTRQIRARDLRPVCTDCATATDRANTVIEHPPGAETQWDWCQRRPETDPLSTVPDLVSQINNRLQRLHMDRSDSPIHT